MVDRSSAVNENSEATNSAVPRVRAMKPASLPTRMRISTAVGSPAPGQRSALGEARRGLDAQHHVVVEFGQVAGTGVGGGAAHARTDGVDQVFHAGTFGIHADPRTGDALLEELFSGAVVGRVAGRSGGHG